MTASKEKLYNDGLKLLETSIKCECPEGVDLLEKAAKLGHQGAQYKLGKLFEKGSYVSKDQTKALCFFKSAAQQGHVKAGIRVARLSPDESNVEDTAIEVQYLERAALTGSAEAQIMLGLRFFHGNGVVKDVERARVLLISAAQKKSTYALVLLQTFFTSA